MKATLVEGAPPYSMVTKSNGNLKQSRETTARRPMLSISFESANFRLPCLTLDTGEMCETDVGSMSE